MVEGIFSKSAQITKLLQTISPCQLCGRSFKRGHTCTVATQLAALVLHGIAEPGNPLQCDVCATVCATMAELHTHLSTAHELPVHDWNAARDSLPDANGCSHCGTPFTTRAGLRRHITDGRCPNFNPSATNVPLPAAKKWETMLATGDFTKQGLTAHQRLQLTLTCQLRGETYSRSIDLSAHLQQCHAGLWKRALNLVKFLLQTSISRTGCMCNPCATEAGHGHVCNMIRQAAMIFLTSEQDILLPRIYTEPELRVTLHNIAHRQALPNLINVMMDRDFSHMWHAPLLLQLFRTWCIICGGWQHTAAMVTHQLQCHHDECMWAAQVKFQLVQCMQLEQTDDFHCRFCHMTYNTAQHDDPDSDARRELMQIHLASNCPVVQQIALVLLPIHGRPDHDGSIRHGASELLCQSRTTDDAGKPVSAPKRRRTLEQTAQARTCSQREPHTARDAASSSGNVQTDGTSPHQPRQSAPAPGQRRLLHYLRPDRHRECAATAHAEDSGVEGHHGEAGSRQPEMAHPENVSPQEHGGGDSAARGEVVPDHTGSPTMGHGGERRGHSPGWLVDLPEMGSTEPLPHHLSSQAAADGQGPEGATTPSGIAGGEHAGSPVLWPEGAADGTAMDPSALQSRRRCMENPAGHEPLHHLDHGRDDNEAPFPAPESPSSNPDSTAGERHSQRPEQGEVQNEMTTLATRESLRQKLSQLRLLNPGQLCFANCALASFIWTSLSRRTFAYADWGVPQALFKAMLTSSEDTFALDRQPWYQALTMGWADNHRQEDSAEFTSMLVQWVSPAFYNCFWQRKWMQCENLLIHDQGDRYQPINLQLHPSHVTSGIIRLTDLLRTWHNELGMYAGLVRAPEVFCVQIDRFMNAGPNAIHKLTLPVVFTGNIEVPVFLQGQLTCEWITYQAVAAFAHYGGANSGHYQALLRTDQANRGIYAGASWLDCDDGRAARPCTHVPSGFHEGVTCIWLTRADCIELHDWQPPAPDNHTGEDLLSLLTNTA